MNPCINCNIIDKLYRPTWTCGRYDAATQSAIMYNLIAGFSFFFENKSAEIVGMLLTFSRGDCFTFDDLVETLEITKETLSPFIDELLNLGLLSDKPINDKVVTNEMGHQVARNVLHAVTATKVDTCQRTCNLAVLVAELRTSETQYFVDNRTYITGKFLSHVKNSSKRSDFLRFYAYLCHVIEDFFACLETQH